MTDDTPTAGLPVRGVYIAMLPGYCDACGNPFPTGAFIGYSRDINGWISTCCSEAT